MEAYDTNEKKLIKLDLKNREVLVGRLNGVQSKGASRNGRTGRYGGLPGINRTIEQPSS